MNDCIKSCRSQRITVFDLSGKEGDGDSGCEPACCLQHAERNLSRQRLSVSLAFTRDDEVTFPHAVCKMDGLQDGVDARMHFRAQADREGGADAAGRAGARQLVGVDPELRFPSFCLPAEPSFQRCDTLLVRPFLGTEYHRGSSGSGQGDIHIVEGVDPEGFGQGSKGLQEAFATVHDRRASETDPDFFYTLLNSILH